MNFKIWKDKAKELGSAGDALTNIENYLSQRLAHYGSPIVLLTLVSTFFALCLREG